MTNKQKLAQSEAEGIVPALRFPEFLNDGEWKIETFKNITKINQGLQIPISERLTEKVNESHFYITNEFLKATCEKYYYIKNPPKSVLCNKEEVLMTRTGNTGQVVTNVEGAFHNNFFKIDFDRKTVDKDFLVYFLRLSQTQRKILSYAGASTIPDLNHSDFYRITISLPPKKEEQQKIATCLSSLDEVITAETEKLDLLQDHKKGLLQQLFPAEGETQPKFRFPEFKDDGDWEVDNFSSYIKLYRGSSPRPISQYTTKDENGVNWIKIGDTKNANGFKISSVEEKITALGAKKSRKVKRGELILANSMSYGATYELDLEGCIYDGWFVLREFEESFDKNFLLQLLNSDYLQSQYKRLAAGGIVQNISSEIVYATLLPKPSLKEQQKIADCLSAADALIEAQAQKIEQLQEHKKGLLQQLFPNING
ncbi:MAG: restriction endonuclease subunit S [Flavobacteriales bacterium]|nr:restriction endonuclease subunit S [Flavobacteriales bacterium]